MSFCLKKKLIIDRSRQHIRQIDKAHSSTVNVNVFKSCNLSEQTHDHLNGCAADGTTTTLTFHLVGARLTEAPVPTWHKRDPVIALCDEADFAVVALVSSTSFAEPSQFS